MEYTPPPVTEAHIVPVLAADITLGNCIIVEGRLVEVTATSTRAPIVTLNAGGPIEASVTDVFGVLATTTPKDTLF